ncbi:hypothetical protein B0H17DRAFT_1148959 [Mycena rosella]|uniref:Uncharacterized protein n=1 Tax=Mycena rosella TaxID=1033263 RepID=A0AAD7C6Q1_MYCRO|nr:hypothetical protein B0H17DRAFT_1148959 [Mycena rosella]
MAIRLGPLAVKATLATKHRMGSLRKGCRPLYPVIQEAGEYSLSLINRKRYPMGISSRMRIVCLVDRRGLLLPASFKFPRFDGGPSLAVSCTRKVVKLESPTLDLIERSGDRRQRCLARSPRARRRPGCVKIFDPLATPDLTGVVPGVYILQNLSSEPLASDPKNHYIRHIEILRVLYTHGLNSRFDSWRGSVIILSNLRGIFHTDKTRDGYVQSLRPTRHPVKYYWIDLDLSGVHDPSAGPPLVDTRYGGNHDVPEWAFPDQQCNPLTRFGLSEKSPILGFEFMHELVADMCPEDPAKRPSMVGSPASRRGRERGSFDLV